MLTYQRVTQTNQNGSPDISVSGSGSTGILFQKGIHLGFRRRFTTKRTRDCGFTRLLPADSLFKMQESCPEDWELRNITSDCRLLVKDWELRNPSVQLVSISGNCATPLYSTLLPKDWGMTQLISANCCFKVGELRNLVGHCCVRKVRKLRNTCLQIGGQG